MFWVGVTGGIYYLTGWYVDRVNAPWYPWYQVFFNFGAPLLPLFLWPVGNWLGAPPCGGWLMKQFPRTWWSRLSSATTPTRIVAVMYYIFAALATIVHVRFVVQSWFDLPTAWKLWLSVLRDPASNGPLYFLLVDCISLLASCFYWVLFWSGPIDACVFLVRSLTVGPGASLLLHGAEREVSFDVKSKKSK